MRMKKAWIVARKEFSEFRANRQILLTLGLFPILMTLIPAVMMVPLASFLAQPPAREPPIQLRFLAFYESSELRDTTLNDAMINRSTIVGGYVNNSYVNNSTMIDVVVQGSLLDNVTISNAVIISSILRNSNYDKNSCQIINTVLSGSTKGPSEDVKYFFDMFAHSLLLFMFFIMAVAMPTTIASFTFVGEKTNKTLEPLLSTPLTDMELLMGKYLAVFVPVYSLILVSFCILTATVAATTYPVLGYLLIPDATWLLGIFVVTPLICLLGIAINVLISTRVSDVRVAQQYSAFIIIPVMLVLFVGSIGGTGGIGVGSMIITCLIMLVAMLVTVWLSLRVFNREDVLTSWK